MTKASTARRMTGSTSMCSKASSATTPTSTIPSFSTCITQTLNPCVVLMKELIGQYTDQWKDKGRIYSLAQGVMYWKPPKVVVQAIQDALTSDDDDDDDKTKNTMLHMYGPDEGLLELRRVLQDKIATENGLMNHSIMVMVGANQAYVNCVLMLLDQHHKAIIFAPEVMLWLSK